MVCSVHPMLAFAGKNVPTEQISKAYFTLEGGEQALEVIKNVLSICKNPYRIISAQNKVKYHAAACFASNFVVAVCAKAFELMNECGFSEDEARSALAPLICENAANICKYGIKNSLTGPVSRGDVVTVSKHIAALDDKSKDIYKMLSSILAELSGHDEFNFGRSL